MTTSIIEVMHFVWFLLSVFAFVGCFLFMLSAIIRIRQNPHERLWTGFWFTGCLFSAGLMSFFLRFV